MSGHLSCHLYHFFRSSQSCNTVCIETALLKLLDNSLIKVNIASIEAMYPSKEMSALSEHCSWGTTYGLNCNHTSTIAWENQKSIQFKAILTICSPVCRVQAAEKDDIHVEYSVTLFKVDAAKKKLQICELALRISITHRFCFVFRVRPRRFYKYQSPPMPCQS